MTTTPDAIEPGQVWRDRDQRTKGTGEFTVVAVVSRIEGGTATTGGDGPPTPPTLLRAEQAARETGDAYAVVRRESGRLTRIRLDRMFRGGARGYEYVGRAK